MLRLDALFQLCDISPWTSSLLFASQQPGFDHIFSLHSADLFLISVVFFLRSKAERKSLLFCQWKGVLWRRLPGKHPVDPCNETCQYCQQTHSLSACQLYLCVTHFWSSILPGPSAPAFFLAQPQPCWLPICGAGGSWARGLGFVAQTSSWSHNMLWWLLQSIVSVAILRRQEWDEQQQKNEWVNFLFHLMDILMDIFLLPLVHSVWIYLSMKQPHSPLLGWCR